MEPCDCLLLHRKSSHPGGKVRHLSTSGNRSNLKRRSFHKGTRPRNNLALPRSVTIAYSLPCVRRLSSLTGIPDVRLVASLINPVTLARASKKPESTKRQYRGSFGDRHRPIFAIFKLSLLLSVSVLRSPATVPPHAWPMKMASTLLIKRKSSDVVVVRAL